MNTNTHLTRIIAVGCISIKTCQTGWSPLVNTIIKTCHRFSGGLGFGFRLCSSMLRVIALLEDKLTF